MPFLKRAGWNKVVCSHSGSLHGDALCEDSDEQVPVKFLENCLPLVGPHDPPHFELEVVFLRGALEDVLK